MLFVFPPPSSSLNIFHDSIAALSSLPKSKRGKFVLYVHGELANELVALRIINKHSFWYSFYIFIEKIVVQYADSVVCVDQRLGQYISNSFDREPLIRPNFVMVPDPPFPVRPLEINQILYLPFGTQNGVLRFICIARNISLLSRCTYYLS